MPPCLFFDLDNTLMDHDHASRLAAATFQQRHAAAFTMRPDRFARQWHHLIETAYTMYSVGRLSLAQARRWRMIRLFGAAGISISDDDAQRYVDEALADYAEHWQLYPDVRPALKRLRPWLGGIITNGGPAQQHAKFSRLKLDRFFHHLLISDEIGATKPDPRIFREARKRMGHPARNCIFVGDSRETDIRGAFRAGWQAIWIQRRCRVGGPIRIREGFNIHHMDQVAAIIRRIMPASNAPWLQSADPCPHRCRW